MDAAVRKRSIELYAILLSFVRQRPAKLVRGVPSNNGFEAWRVLMGEMQPATRQQQLALMAQLAGIRFDANRSLAEQIVKYEAAPTNLQTQLHLTMDESTDYKAIREKLLAYETASTRWQPSSGFALLAVTAQGTLNQGGPADMEIDRVEKGKGGHKGGKQGGHKGKKGEKGKGKGKEKGGKGKKGGKGGPPGYTCGGRHFVRDCPKGKGRGKNVNQVNQEQATATAPPASNTAPTMPAPTTTRTNTTSQPPANSVRRVRLVTPPDANTNTTYVFDISDNDVVTDFYDDFLKEPAVRAVSVRSPPSRNRATTRPRDHRAGRKHGAMRAMGDPLPGNAAPPRLTDAQGNDIRVVVRAITEVPRSLPPKLPKVTISVEMAAATDFLDPWSWHDATLYKACVRTRNRGDRHSQGANRDVRLPILQVDFYFASLEEGGERPSPEGEQENWILIGVDLDTKMVLAVPGPNTGTVILATLRGSAARHPAEITDNTGHTARPAVTVSVGSRLIEAEIAADGPVDRGDRLEKMTVLVDPAAWEEAEHLSTVFVKTWKYDKARGWYEPVWWRGKTSGAWRWDAFLQVEQPADEPVLVTSPSPTRQSSGKHGQWKLGRVLPGQRKGSQKWFYQLSGDVAEDLESMEEAKIQKTLKSKYQVKVSGPFQLPGDMYEFLRRRHQFEADGSITIRVATRFYQDLYELAGRPKKRSTPGGHTVPLGEEQGHLIMDFSDSNFANDRTTRRSLSSGQIFIGQALTLSSGEAELVELTQTTSECILVKKVWEFLVSDSSVARAIASRLGVGRVRHLQTSCLWIQQWVAQHLLKVLAVPTEFNPADLGTKCFTAKRLRLLCYLVGLVHDNGEHVCQNEFRFGPAGPSELFEDLASLIYLMVVVLVRYLWFVGLLALAWWMGRRSTTSSGNGGQEAIQHDSQVIINQEGQSGNTNHNHSRDVADRAYGHEQRT
ncbi:unnamed protein product [Symbiodinium sp. CCMP2592]|nr:unnamed protein product [Symbiodinium sp. CCMP2592]